jgi:hypothetical protein
MPVVYFSGQAPLVAGELFIVAGGAPVPGQEFLPPLSEGEKKITAELEKPTNFEFNETPLVDAIDYLKDLHQIEIQLDTKALENAGIDGDSPMTIKVAKVPLRAALRRVLSSLELAYIVQDDMLLITTNELASVTLVTRTYPVADLTADGDFKILVGVITETVKPRSWNMNTDDGAGAITAVKTAGSLVISQTHEIHDEILSLLRALRAARQAGGGEAK